MLRPLLILTTLLISPVIAIGQTQAGGNGQPGAATPAGSAQQTPPQQAGTSPQQPQSFEQAYAQSGGSLNTMEDPPAAPSAGGPGGGTRTSSLFAVTPKQPRRMQKFDLVTVIIREESDSKTSSNTDLQKNTDFNALLEQYIDLNLGEFRVKGKPALANQPNLRFQGQRNFQGEGSVDRSDSVSARVQAQVIDVKPNGILIIQATKMIKTDAEEQKFVLTGMVRAEDVTPDNSVLSTQLADLMLEKTTKGQASDASRRGFVPWLMDKLNPF